MYLDVFFTDEPEDKDPFEGLRLINGLFWHGLIDSDDLTSYPLALQWSELPADWKRPSGEPWHTFGGKIREG